MATAQLIAWGPGLAVGVHAIDTQHQELVRLANKLNSAMAEGRGREVLGPIFTELIRYTPQHFTMEEGLMTRHGYSGSVEHKKLHKDLVDKVLALKAQFDAGKLTISVQIMQFLRDWLNGHIQKTDKEFAKFLNANNVK